MNDFTPNMLLMSCLINFVGIFLLSLFGWVKQDEISKGSWLLKPVLQSILVLSIIGLICLAISFKVVV